MSTSFTIKVTVDEDQEIAFKREFRTLASKYMALAPPEGYFGPMTEKEKNEERDRIIREKRKEIEEIARKKEVPSPKKKDIAIPIDPDFQNIKTHCWKKFGLPKNLVGESFKDNPDDSDLSHKIIGYQPNNLETPVISIDDNGIRRKWSIQQMCTYFGVSRGFIIEELSSDSEATKQAKKEKKEKKEKDKKESKTKALDAKTKKTKLVVVDENGKKVEDSSSDHDSGSESDAEEEKEKVEQTTNNDNESSDGSDSDSSSSSCISVTTSTTTTVKTGNEVVPKAVPPKATPPTTGATSSTIPPKRPKMVTKFKDIELSPPQPRLPQLSRIIPSNMPFLPKELETMTDTEMSKYYGFDRNMIGVTFNNPTPKKGAPRIFEIYGFDIKKAKYPVVAIQQTTKKSQNFSTEQIKEFLLNPMPKK